MSTRHRYHVVGGGIDGVQVDDIADIFEPDCHDHFTGEVNYDGNLVHAVVLLTGSSGGFHTADSSIRHDRTARRHHAGYWRRYVVPGQRLDVTVTYLGADDAVPPIPDNIVLGYN